MVVKDSQIMDTFRWRKMTEEQESAPAWNARGVPSTPYPVNGMSSWWGWGGRREGGGGGGTNVLVLGWGLVTLVLRRDWGTPLPWKDLGPQATGVPSPSVNWQTKWKHYLPRNSYAGHNKSSKQVHWVQLTSKDMEQKVGECSLRTKNEC